MTPTETPQAAGTVYVDHATPTRPRAIAAYKARNRYKPGPVVPPSIPNVVDAIDLHAHAHEGQQDAFGLAQVASESSMRGILYKTIGPHKDYRPAQRVRDLQERLNVWCEQKRIRPVTCWAGYTVCGDGREPQIGAVREQLDVGACAVWLPVSNHANSYYTVGLKGRILNPAGDPRIHTDPIPWDEALKYGFYMLDDNGRLKTIYAEIIRLVVDRGALLFFGHATQRERLEVVALLDSLGRPPSVIDHPFSPFIELTPDMMREFSQSGVHFNFTYDELSPLLGVDPAEMWRAIQYVGIEHCTISSDAGEPLFPHSVECMRLIRGYMEAYGASPVDVAALSETTPAKLLGVD